MQNEHDRRWTALAISCALLTGCRGGFEDPAPNAAPDRAADAPRLRLSLTASAADSDGPLPRELEGGAVGRGMTVGETRIRMPGLTPDRSIDFAASPRYFVCDEITATRNYILSRPRDAAALHARPRDGPESAVSRPRMRDAAALHARPRDGGLGSLEFYALDGTIAASRGLYADQFIRSVPYEDFVARALEKYGRSVRSESLAYSDGTIVRYTLWQNQETTILIGETAVPTEAFVSRYIYFIDGGLLRDSYRAAAGRRPGFADHRVL